MSTHMTHLGVGQLVLCFCGRYWPPLTSHPVRIANSCGYRFLEGTRRAPTLARPPNGAPDSQRIEQRHAGYRPRMGSNPVSDLRRNARSRHWCLGSRRRAACTGPQRADARGPVTALFGVRREAHHVGGTEPPQLGPCCRDDPEGFNLRQFVSKSVPCRANGGVASTGFS